MILKVVAISNKKTSIATGKQSRMCFDDCRGKIYSKVKTIETFSMMCVILEVTKIGLSTKLYALFLTFLFITVFMANTLINPAICCDRDHGYPDGLSRTMSCRRAVDVDDN